jgi:hypothetical protein
MLRIVEYIAHHDTHYIVEYTDRFHVAFVLKLYSVHCRKKGEYDVIESNTGDKVL